MQDTNSIGKIFSRHALISVEPKSSH